MTGGKTMGEGVNKGNNKKGKDREGQCGGGGGLRGGS